MNNNKGIVFGTRPVLEVIKSEKEIEKIFIQKNTKRDILFSIISLCKKKNVNMSFVPKEKLNRITKKNHQGVICYISQIVYQPIDRIIQSCFEKGKEPLILILDRITDIRNFGAITRAGDCLGVDAIIIPSTGSALISSDAFKTSSGALHHVPICKEKNLINTIRYLKNSGLKIVCCTEKSDKEIYMCNYKIPTAIILGSEENGISSDLLKLSDEKVKIPMLGKLESLNVSSSASVVLYEAVRQRLN